MSNFILSAFADEIDSDLDTQIKVLKQHGVNHIEMRGVNGKNLTAYSLEEVKEIKKKLDQNGFKISAVGSPIGKIGIKDDFKPHFELFLHTIEIAKILETKYIRIFSFFIPEGEEAEIYRDEVMQRLKQFVTVAEKEEMILLHENEKDIYGDMADRCLDILKTVNSKSLRATFDPANFVQCDEKVFPYAFELLEPYVDYMHIKDALYKDHSVVPAGIGDGEVKKILNRLNLNGFEGFLSLEPHLASFDGFAELEISAKVDKPEAGEGAKKFSIAHSALVKLMKNYIS